MLKLERVARKLDLSITLRKREPFFSPAMLKAIIIGLTIHLGAVFLFPIASYKFGGALSLLPSVSVVVDIPQHASGSVVVELDREELSSRYLQPPKRIFALPELEIPIVLPTEEVSLLTANHPIAFLLDPVPKFDQPIKVHVSGPLSQHRRLSQDPALPSLPQGIFYAKFHVAMENRTGKIFWFECRECQNQKMQRFAEEILSQMRFETSEEAFVTAGDVEITIGKT